MKRRWIIALGLVAAAIAAYVLFGRGGDSAGNREPAVATPNQTNPPKRAEPDRSDTPDQQRVASQLQMDTDPAGDLRLEGVVLDDTDDPVAGASVYLDSRPPRTMVTGADGTFGFDALVGRRYGVRARADGRVGGPVVLSLTESSDPAIIRLRAGGAIEVTVVSRDGAAPVSNASVSIEAMPDVIAHTDGDGKASLVGVPIGWGMLVVKATGYATSRSVFRTPETAGTPLQHRVELEPGVRVAGLVVDERGKPVQKARVVARPNATPWAPVDVLGQGVTTDKRGRFVIEALSAGSYRFLAVHDDFAPGSSELVSISEAQQPDVRIVMSAGTVVAGRVLDADGGAAAWAQVTVTSVAGMRSSWGGGSQRAIIADEEGAFEVRGLARAEMKLYATSATASSEIVSVDTNARDEVRDVELRLTVQGTIAGVVVDENDQPIAEAQVVAQPDFWSGQASEDMAMRGAAFGTSDGDGRFTIRGLASGKYLLRAARTDLATDRGVAKPVAAASGDTAVRIVLATEGSIKGKVQLTDGSTPTLASASLTGGGVVVVVKGRFVLDGVPPGTYDVTVRGTQFPDKTLRDVVVKPGKATDVGTIEVTKGRAVFGRVIDAKGAPVGGARVVLARQIFGDGANMVTALDDTTAQQLGLRRTVADDDGRYRLEGVGDDVQALAAEHADHGRSIALEVPKGAADVPADLTLVPLGTVFGKVTTNGEPASGVTVIATATASSRQNRVAESGLDGGFELSGLAAGDYKVTAMIGSGGAATMAAKQVTVVGGERVEVVLDIAVGDITLDVVISAKEGAQVDAAQVFLFDNPEVSVTNGGALNKLFLSESKAGGGKMVFSTGGNPARFESVSAGARALCAIPITGDLNDPVFGARLQADVDRIAVYCSRIDIKPAPSNQTHPLALPAMSFL